MLQASEPEAVHLGEQLNSMQDAFQRQSEVKDELEAELDRVQQDLEVVVSSTNPESSIQAFFLKDAFQERS